MAARICAAILLIEDALARDRTPGRRDGSCRDTRPFPLFRDRQGQRNSASHWRLSRLSPRRRACRQRPWIRFPETGHLAISGSRSMRSLWERSDAY
ncbi:hypothetical protein BDW75DRAFT_204748 [Aspergillus navahoensis]